VFDALPPLARVSWRSLWRNRRRTIITLSSIAFGLALALFMVGLAEGVYAKLIDDAIRLQSGHVTVMHRKYLDAPASDLFVRNSGAMRRMMEKIPGVERTKALVMGQALVKTPSGAVGVMVMGVEPAVERAASPLAKKIRQGKYLSSNNGPEIIIGQALADRLRLRVGKKLVVAANDANGQMIEELCRVRGIFRMDTDELDGYFVQVPIGFARRVFGLPRDSATEVGVILHDPDTRHAVADLLAQLPGIKGYGVHTWEKVLPEISGYIRLDRASNWIFQGLLIFLVLFTIFNTIFMSVMERGREFGVLLAIGTAPMRLRAQVFLEALFMDLLGCVLGIIIGSAGVLYFKLNGLDMSKMTKSEMSIGGIGMEMIVRPALTPGIVGWVGGLIFAVTLILSLYPVWKSAKINVAEVLR